MGPRQLLLVGSLPATDAYDAMSTAMRLLGPHLRALPDGETGDVRKNWLVGLCDSSTPTLTSR